MRPPPRVVDSNPLPRGEEEPSRLAGKKLRGYSLTDLSRRPTCRVTGGRVDLTFRIVGDAVVLDRVKLTRGAKTAASF